ncbi:MAG: CoA transferase [Thaumarchaeota archaeon]|nr:CoA transferase [Nitrososphaerota archaeon]
MPQKLPLSGFVVLDMTHQVAGPFCSMLLADLGAEVIKIERPPTGDTARNWAYFGPSIFLALNRNKKSIALNLSTPSGREAFEKLVKRADVFIENLAPGVAKKLGADYPALRRAKKDIIYCSISGYGKNNPYSSLPAWDPVIQALSGLMSVTGERDREPVRIGVSVVDMGAGMMAALGIVSSLLSKARNRKESSKSVLLDISLFDSATVWMGFWVVYYSLYNKVPERNGSAWPAFVPYQAFRAKDGYVFIGASNNDYWNKLCVSLGAESLLKEERFSTNELRIQNSTELLRLLEDITLKIGRDELVTLLRKAEIPCSPVNNVKDLVNDAALGVRGMIGEMLDPTGRKFLSVSNALGVSGLGVKKPKAPPKLGRDTARILRSLGYSSSKTKRILQENQIH